MAGQGAVVCQMGKNDQTAIDCFRNSACRNGKNDLETAINNLDNLQNAFDHSISLFYPSHSTLLFTRWQSLVSSPCF